MDGDIQSRKIGVHRYEGCTNRYGEELKQLESTIKEGLFCVEWCLVLSVSSTSYEISLLNTIILWLVIHYSYTMAGMMYWPFMPAMVYSLH